MASRVVNPTAYRLRTEAAGVLAIKVVGTGFAFAAQLLLARMLGAEGVGAYALAMALMNSVLVFSRMGFDVSSLRVLTLLVADGDPGRQRGFIRAARLVPTVVGVALALVCAAATVVAVPAGSVRRSLIVATVGIPLWTLILVDQGLLRALGRRVGAFLAGEGARPALFVVGLWLMRDRLSDGSDAPFAVGLHVLAIASAAALGSVILGGTIPREVRGARAVLETRSWIRASVALGVVTALSALLNQLDTLIIGTILPPAEVGLFSVSRRIATLLSFGLLAVTSVVAPQFSRLYRDGDRAGLAALARRAARLATLATLPGVILLVGAGRLVLGWFGPDFAPAYPLLVVFCAGQLMNAACGPVALLLSLTGHARDTARVLAWGLGLLVAGLLVVVPRFGVIGAAATSAAVLAAWNLTLVAVCSHRMGIRASII